MIALVDYERCPLKDANDCDARSWIVRSDGFRWYLWCGGFDCPFKDRKRAAAEWIGAQLLEALAHA